MKKGKLIFITDPHCGWCYAKEKSIKDLQKFYQDDLDFEVLSAGMWVGKNAKRGGEEMFDFILPSVMRIKQFFKVDFDGPYLDLIKDPTYLLASDWPSRAMTAMNVIDNSKTLEFTYNLMQQQFVKGMRYDVEKTYINALEGLDVDITSFLKLWKSEEVKKQTEEIFSYCNEITKSLPTLLYKNEHGIQKLNNGYFTLPEMVKKIDDIREFGLEVNILD